MRILPRLIGILLLGIIIIVGVSVVYQMLQRQNAIINQQLSEIDSLKSQANNINTQFGESLFSKNCQPCHPGKMYTDNMLYNIVDRLGEPYLSLYLTKQDSLIKAKDKYAIEIKAAYHNMKNSHNFKFTKAEMDAIISFLR